MFHDQVFLASILPNGRFHPICQVLSRTRLFDEEIFGHREHDRFLFLDHTGHIEYEIPVTIFGQVLDNFQALAYNSQNQLDKVRLV